MGDRTRRKRILHVYRLPKYVSADYSLLKRFTAYLEQTYDIIQTLGVVENSKHLQDLLRHIVPEKVLHEFMAEEKFKRKKFDAVLLEGPSYRSSFAPYTFTYATRAS